MIPEVIPISMPQVDLPTLLSVGRSTTGRNLASQLDSSSGRLTALLRYLTALEALAGRETPPFNAAQGSTLRHIHFGFLVNADPEDLIKLMVLGSNSLAFTLSSERTTAVVSGDLEAWKNLLVQKTNSSYIRMILNSFYTCFSQAGLGWVWGEYGKKQVDPDTFALVRL